MKTQYEKFIKFIISQHSEKLSAFCESFAKFQNEYFDFNIYQSKQPNEGEVFFVIKIITNNNTSYIYYKYYKIFSKSNPFLIKHVKIVKFHSLNKLQDDLKNIKTTEEDQNNNYEMINLILKDKILGF